MVAYLGNLRVIRLAREQVVYATAAGQTGWPVLLVLPSDAVSVRVGDQRHAVRQPCRAARSPPAAGLFARVILQSGSCDLNWPAGGLGPGVPAGSFFAPTARLAPGPRAASAW